MDLERDLFRIHGSVSREAVDRAVRQLKYRPSPGDASSFRASSDGVPEGEPPAFVRDALARASREGRRFVLVDCLGDR
jgi:hypothetical protein